MMMERGFRFVLAVTSFFKHKEFGGLFTPTTPTPALTPRIRPQPAS